MIGRRTNAQTVVGTTGVPKINVLRRIVADS